MIKKAKSIQEIYDEVKGYDLVLTVDAPLRTALDRLLKKPMLGTWAMTPKELAVKYAPLTIGRSVRSKFDAIVEISRRLRISIKQIHYYVDQLLNLWEINGNLDNIYESLNDEGRSVFNLLKKFPTVNLAMNRFDPSLIDKNRIAVIGLDFFTKLDKSVLPHNFDAIDIFKDETYDLSNFYAFSSENDLIDRLVSMINEGNANDLAIVLDPESSYLPLIRSKLKNKGIPITIKEYLKDHFQVRNFLALINLGLNHTNLTVKEIAHFADTFSFDVDVDKHSFFLSEYLLSDTDNQGLMEFCNLLDNVTNMTYKEVIDRLSERNITLPYELSDIIYQLNLTNRRIDFESYAELTYCIENMEIEIDTNKNGVLLVSCKSSAYVDRPVCFYVGLDTSWDRESKSETIDNDVEEKKGIDLFQILIQQGMIRYYLVSTIKDNQPVIPCYYFNMLFGREIGSFTSDPIFNAQRIRNSQNADEKMLLKDNVKVEKNAIFKYFSQSRLNDFVACPKRYMYGNLTFSEQKDLILKGNLFHEFASFYIIHPDVFKKLGIDFFVDYMIREYKKMVDDAVLDIERSKFKVGLKNLCSYIDSLSIDKDINLPSHVKADKENRFIKLLGLTSEGTNTELKFVDDEIHIDGIFDLMVNNVTIVDHKSGNKPKSRSEIVKKSHTRPKDEPDYQAKLYILEMRRNNPSDLEFIYNYFMADYENVIDGKNDVTGELVTIKYYHKDFNEFITTTDGIELLSSTSDSRKGIIEKIGHNNIMQFFMENPIPREMQFDSDLLLNSDYRERFCSYLSNFVNSRSKNISENIADILKGIVMIRNANAPNIKTVYFFKDDIDEFEEFLTEKYNEVLSYINDNFPFKPINRNSCDECNYSDICLRRYKT
ncbi:TPA: hypothetical protein ENX78_07535 [Candidatus Poribacteria bacterium]|nr:hypothetical protein [Candidatus Poribacteria bacterium]